jgi:hypothetical protein
MPGFAIPKTTAVWLQGLFAAGISTFATAASGLVMLPTVFNFTHNGLINMVKLAGGPAMVAVFTYLQKSPLPGLIEPGDKATIQNPVIAADGSMTGSSATLVKAPVPDATIPPKP